MWLWSRPQLLVLRLETSITAMMMQLSLSPAAQDQHHSYSRSRIVIATRTPILAATCLELDGFLFLATPTPTPICTTITNQRSDLLCCVSYSCCHHSYSSCWHTSNSSYCYQLRIMTTRSYPTLSQQLTAFSYGYYKQRYGYWDLRRQLWLQQLWWCNFHALPKTSITATPAPG